tara:strand:- start:43318 stop:45411 length:2094 start_codon:yes stop_codon:yes gene_type:complete
MNNKLLSLMIENAEALKQNTLQNILDLMKSTIRNEVELAVRNEIEAAARDEYEENKEKEPNYILNYQMPQTRSKTGIALNDIVKNHRDINHNRDINHIVKNHALVSQNHKGAEKLISIVMANNSLLETFAWGGRTAKIAGKEFNITRIASNAKTAQGEFYNDEPLIQAYSCSVLKILNHIHEKKNTKQPALPADIIIMCNNKSRMDSLNNLITQLTKLTKNLPIKFKFNIIFDECDKFSGPIINFIKTLYKDESENNIKSTIDNIQFISGTMKSDFLNKLSRISPKCGELLNLAYDSESSVNNEKVSVPLYKTVLNQKHIPFEGPTKPINYIKKYNEEHRIDSSKTYFVPGENKVETHNEISEFFRSKGLYVLILNGKEKKILSPHNSNEEDYDIKQDLGKPVNNSENSELTELRHILCQWREKHKNKGLAITGCNVLERGLTFLTDGFCFDYMIISGYFSAEIKSIEFLIQLLGRGQGVLQFVNNFHLVMPRTLYDDAQAYIQRSEELINSNVEYYTPDLFEYVEVGANLKTNDTNATFCLIYNDIKAATQELKRLKCIIQYTSTWEPRIPKREEWELKKAKGEIDQDSVFNPFIEHSFRGPKTKRVWSLDEAIKSAGGLRNKNDKNDKNEKGAHRLYPCYEDTNDSTTLKWVFQCRKSDKRFEGRFHEDNTKLRISAEGVVPPIFSKLVEKIIMQ